MTTSRHDTDAPDDAHAWMDAALRRLPMQRADADVDAILASTVDRAPSSESAPVAPRPSRRPRLIVAAAALLALTSAIAWWSAPGTTRDRSEYSEHELARIEADLERALVHAGRIVNRAERVAFTSDMP